MLHITNASAESSGLVFLTNYPLVICVKIQERRILYNLLQKSTCLFNLVSYEDHNAFAAVSVNAFCIPHGLYSESKQTNLNLNSPVSELDSTSLPEREASLISNFNFHLSGLCSLYWVFIFL